MIDLSPHTRSAARFARPARPLLALLAGIVLLPCSMSYAAGWGPLELLSKEVAPGESTRLSFITHDSFIKESLDMNILVARGVRPGPTLCLTAAIHGDELNGVEIARDIFEATDAGKLSGTLIAVPIVNVWGLRSGNRYLADRRDLNRAFPGNLEGSMAARIAFVLFEGLIRRCDALIDLHTGSGDRANVPQIRVDLENERASELAMQFGIGIVMGGGGPIGSLRRAATDAGVPAIIYEAGGPYRFEYEEIARGIEGVHNVMEALEMVEVTSPLPSPPTVFRSSSWVRAKGGGIFMTDRSLGDEVQEGDLLGTVTDPVNNDRVEIRAPRGGILVGRAHPQVVLPGFGLFHIARAEAGELEGPEVD